MTTATKYLGVKLVSAEPEVKNSVEGMAVTYADGYKSWSPKDVFDAAYFPITDWQYPKMTATMTPEEHDAGIKVVAAKGDAVTLRMVSEILGDKVGIDLDGSGGAIARATLPNGVKIESAFDVEPGMEGEALVVRGREKLRSIIWPMLDFVLRWALNGIKIKGKRKAEKASQPMWATEPGSKPKAPKAPKAPPAPKPVKSNPPEAPKVPKAPKPPKAESGRKRKVNA